MTARSARRELGVALGGCVLAAALILIAGGREWVHFDVVLTPLPSVHGVASGHRVAGALTSLGLVVLAAAVALVATRRLGRQAAGVLVAAVGVLSVVLAIHVVSAPRTAVAGSVAAATGRAGLRASTVSVSGWPWVAAMGGLVAVAVGALTVVRGRRWPSMGRRYAAAPQSQAASQAATTRDETSMWDALDRGDDPTV